MIYAMSDIHGNIERFESILNQIDLQDNDVLYVLGDVIDRYPDGIEILQKLIQMPNAIMLRGNHEQRFLEINSCCDDEIEFDFDVDDLRTYEHFLDLSPNAQKEILNYIAEMPLQLEISINQARYTLVHAAPREMFDQYSDRFELYFFDSDEEDFILNYRIRIHDEVNDESTVIFGHTPTVYYNAKVPCKIWKAGQLINIDCGSGYPNGRLACLRLDDMKEFYSIQ